MMNLPSVASHLAACAAALAAMTQNDDFRRALPDKVFRKALAEIIKTQAGLLRDIEPESP